METVTRVWMPYTFVAFNSGYTRRAPHGVEAGDVFCLFDACIVPFLLRPTDTDTFILWGDGYVQGILPGQQPRANGSPKQWFKLV
jgi:hypothetical protein